MSQNLKEQHRTAQTHKNASEPLRIHKNTSWTSEKASESSGTFKSCSKHIGLRMPRNISGTFQNCSQQTITPLITSEHCRTSDNCSEHSRTFQNHLKPMRCLRMPHSRSPLKSLRTNENTSECLRTFKNVRECLRPPGTFQNHENAPGFPTKHLRMSLSTSEPSGTFQNCSEALSDWAV